MVERHAGASGTEAAATEAAGPEALSVHRGRAVPGPGGDLVCFSGRGPGEVFQGERKVMGISQWRSREGSLFHTCAYAHWDPSPLIDLLAVDSTRRAVLQRDLPRAAVGILDLSLPTGAGVALGPETAPVAGPPSLPELEQTLLTTFSTWEKDAPPRPG